MSKLQAFFCPGALSSKPLSANQWYARPDQQPALMPSVPTFVLTSQTLTNFKWCWRRVKLGMEDGSQAEHVTGYYSNMTADCKDSTNQNVPMELHTDPADGSRLICAAVQQVACELATTYKVGLRLHCVLVRVPLHVTMQYLV